MTTKDLTGEYDTGTACSADATVLNVSMVADHIDTFLDTVRGFAFADTSRLSSDTALELHGALQHAGALLAGASQATISV